MTRTIRQHLNDCFKCGEHRQIYDQFLKAVDAVGLNEFFKMRGGVLGLLKCEPSSRKPNLNTEIFHYPICIDQNNELPNRQAELKFQVYLLETQLLVNPRALENLIVFQNTMESPEKNQGVPGLGGIDVPLDQVAIEETELRDLRDKICSESTGFFAELEDELEKGVQGQYSKYLKSNDRKEGLLNILDLCFFRCKKNMLVLAFPFLTSPVMVLFIPYSDATECFSESIRQKLKSLSQCLQTPISNYVYSRILDILSQQIEIEESDLVERFCLALSDVLVPLEFTIDHHSLDDRHIQWSSKGLKEIISRSENLDSDRLDWDENVLKIFLAGSEQEVSGSSATFTLLPNGAINSICLEGADGTSAEVVKESVSSYLQQLYELMFSKWEYHKNRRLYEEASRLHAISGDIKRLIDIDDERRSIYMRIKEAMGWATEDFLDYFVDLKPLFYSGRSVRFPIHDGEQTKEVLPTFHSEKNFSKENWLDYRRYLVAFNEGKNNTFLLDLISVPDERVDESLLMPKVLFGLLKLMVQRSHVGGARLHPFQLLYAMYVANKKADITTRIVHMANDPIKCQASEVAMSFQVPSQALPTLTEGIISAAVTPTGVSGLDVCNQWLSSAEERLPLARLPAGFCAANVMGAIIRLIRFELNDDAGVLFQGSILKKEVGYLELQLICSGLFTHNVQLQLSSIHNEAFADERGFRSCIKTLCASVNRLCPTISDNVPEKGADCPGFVIVGEKAMSRTTFVLRWRD